MDFLDKITVVKDNGKGKSLAEKRFSHSFYIFLAYTIFSAVLYAISFSSDPNMIGTLIVIMLWAFLGGVSYYLKMPKTLLLIILADLIGKAFIMFVTGLIWSLNSIALILFVLAIIQIFRSIKKIKPLEGWQIAKIVNIFFVLIFSILMTIGSIALLLGFNPETKNFDKSMNITSVNK